MEELRKTEQQLGKKKGHSMFRNTSMNSITGVCRRDGHFHAFWSRIGMGNMLGDHFRPKWGQEQPRATHMHARKHTRTCRCSRCCKKVAGEHLAVCTRWLERPRVAKIICCFTGMVGVTFSMKQRRRRALRPDDNRKRTRTAYKQQKTIKKHIHKQEGQKKTLSKQ